MIRSLSPVVPLVFMIYECDKFKVRKFLMVITQNIVKHAAMCGSNTIHASNISALDCLKMRKFVTNVLGCRQNQSMKTGNLNFVPLCLKNVLKLT